MSLKVASYSPVLRDPILHYRLDPGEMGLARPSRASRSILSVVGHELGNIFRFKREAARRGGIIVYQGIYLSLSFQGSYLAATAGKAVARIIYSESNNSQNVEPDRTYNGTTEVDQNNGSVGNSNNRVDGNNSYDETLLEVDPPQKTQVLLNKLKAAKRKVVAKLEEIAKEIDREKAISADGQDNFNRQKLYAEELVLERKLREIDSQLDRIQFQMAVKAQEKEEEKEKVQGQPYNYYDLPAGIELDMMA